MATKLGGTVRTRVDGNRAGLVVLVAAALLACNSNKGTQSAPTLTGVTVSPAPAYLSVGTGQQFAALGKYSDGSSSPITTGVTWTSSDSTVVTVSGTGIVVAVGKGTATVSAAASGMTGAANVTARVVTSVASSNAAQPPQAAASVDTTQSYLLVSGLTPGAFYEPTLNQLTDDVDLYVYKDASLSADAELCVSDNVGLTPESCVAPASSAGELYVVVDGTWTEAGSSFVLSVPPATPETPRSTLAYPAQLPLSGSVDTTSALYKVTGLTPSANYVVRISQLTADIDLDVYSDPYLYTSACASFNSGTVDDFCTAAATAAGELYVQVDGESTTNGGSFTLTVAAK